ncbi:hypothetical protein G647_00829 [Cladophialophora carrionii CBS 160.54]|uniref:Uncharacterized protein n=1 Tax=Cladophialophora carrionii CBS 160.54 TaxID=1279043 RepID=V9DND9_9EURO|nr:uncharacterized protein G647_00829 [Cladophialophora carrionii CBS 160.54]ETI28380.1 hypothetical protein G647_00829 [Cladophialophora carrionii CBS 160.54]
MCENLTFLQCDIARYDEQTYAVLVNSRYGDVSMVSLPTHVSWTEARRISSSGVTRPNYFRNQTCLAMTHASMGRSSACDLPSTSCDKRPHLAAPLLQPPVW